jgi:hypothetical protein
MAGFFESQFQSAQAAPQSVTKTFITARDGAPAFNQELMMRALTSIGLSDATVSYGHKEINAAGAAPYQQHTVSVQWGAENVHPEAVHAVMNVRLYDMGFGGHAKFLAANGLTNGWLTETNNQAAAKGI